ncbi:Gfo/Idh/MocA family protein [Aeromicrobium ginsengisoli]|uniref:Gfo/Idh/MocA family oxidoreductase n=1 Tax=Aeromicrobium ginsengisoli TaxID=363867 RepID=A0A5M4FEM1_9ACTN|nr:Gfo/Idh/MocA family oxidoreductase [Aeromicrobium ginsengisoli]KAA1397722.1 Gfo/Idh/MocA family oxidoreductase [Aeromicrobium ginsengisoli]
MKAEQGLRVGVVGCGYWGSKHVRTLLSLEAVSRVCVIDPSAERRSAVTRVYPRVDEYSTLSDALGQLDAVVIAVPPTLHAPLALEAIAHGVHVLVEKPLAPTVTECEAMVTAAEKQGVTLMVGHTFEYHSAVWELRSMVQRGDLGDLYYLDTARLNLGLYQRDVNVVFDLAPHDISILNYVLGSSPSMVECWGARNAHPRLEDVAQLRLYYDDPGVFANVHVSWLNPKKIRQVTMVGSNKMVVFDDLKAEQRVKVHDKGVTAMSDGADLTAVPMSYRHGDIVSPYLEMNEPLRVEDEHFMDCVQTGLRPLTDGESGLEVVRVLEAAQRAMSEGVAVRLPQCAGARTPVPSLAGSASDLLSGASHGEAAG